MKSTNDLWIHRSARMLCKVCMYYCEKKADNENTLLGRCRRHAPTMGGFPVVFIQDWCGDHKLDENKI